MKVIVFGGSGFIGSYTADALTEAGHDVTIYDLKEPQYLNPVQKIMVGDILDRQKVEEVIKGCDVVYNFAAISDIDEAVQKPLETIHTNIIGNTNILEGCRRNKVKRFLFASTIYAYSNLGLFYRSSKQSCELIIENYHKKYGLDFTILRYGSLYGPRSSSKNAIHRFLRQAMEEGKITRYGDGEELREYIHVHDAAKLSVKMLEDEFKNQYVLLTGNQKIKIKDLLLMIKEMLGNKIELEFKDVRNEEHYEITPYSFSPRLARKITDLSHVDLGQGILDLLHHIHSSKAKQGV